MGVGDHDGVDGAERCGRGRDGGGVRLVRRTGVDHHGVDPPDQIGVGAGPGHQPRIRRGQPAHAGRHLVQPARLGCRAQPEVRHRRQRHVLGRGPGAASGPSMFACIDTARTASLKSPSEPLSSGSATGPRS